METAYPSGLMQTKVDQSLFHCRPFPRPHKAYSRFRGDKAMHSRLETQLMTNSKPMLVLAVLIASTLIPPSKLVAQKADQPPMAHEAITLLITKGVAGPPGEQ